MPPSSSQVAKFHALSLKAGTAVWVRRGVTNDGLCDALAEICTAAVAAPPEAADGTRKRGHRQSVGNRHTVRIVVLPEFPEGVAVATRAVSVGLSESVGRWGATVACLSELPSPIIAAILDVPRPSDFLREYLPHCALPAPTSILCSVAALLGPEILSRPIGLPTVAATGSVADTSFPVISRAHANVLELLRVLVVLGAGLERPANAFDILFGKDGSEHITSAVARNLAHGPTTAAVDRCLVLGSTGDTADPVVAIGTWVALSVARGVRTLDSDCMAALAGSKKFFRRRIGHVAAADPIEMAAILSFCPHVDPVYIEQLGGAAGSDGGRAFRLTEPADYLSLAMTCRMLSVHNKDFGSATPSFAGSVGGVPGVPGVVPGQCAAFFAHDGRHVVYYDALGLRLLHEVQLPHFVFLCPPTLAAPPVWTASRTVAPMLGTLAFKASGQALHAPTAKLPLWQRDFWWEHAGDVIGGELLDSLVLLACNASSTQEVLGVLLGQSGPLAQHSAVIPLARLLVQGIGQGTHFTRELAGAVTAAADGDSDAWFSGKGAKKMGWCHVGSRGDPNNGATGLAILRTMAKPDQHHVFAPLVHGGAIDSKLCRFHPAAKLEWHRSPKRSSTLRTNTTTEHRAPAAEAVAAIPPGVAACHALLALHHHHGDAAKAARLTRATLAAAVTVLPAEAPLPQPILTGLVCPSHPRGAPPRVLAGAHPLIAEAICCAGDTHVLARVRAFVEEARAQFAGDAEEPEWPFFRMVAVRSSGARISFASGDSVPPATVHGVLAGNVTLGRGAWQV